MFCYQQNRVRTRNTDSDNNKSVLLLIPKALLKKMIIIIEKFGTEGHLDLMVDKMLRQLEKSMQIIKEDLSLLKATLQEGEMLIKISRCSCTTEVEVLLQEFFSQSEQDFTSSSSTISSIILRSSASDSLSVSKSLSSPTSY